MGDWSSPYFIASQVFIIACYFLVGGTYLTKSRKLILILVIGSSFMRIGSFGFLGAWVAVGVTAVAVLRDATSLALKRKRSDEDNKRITKLDWVLLSVWIIAPLLITVFTYETLWDWFAFFAMILITIGVWQKKVLVYLIMGLFTAVCWIIFCVYTENLFGVICESIMFAVTTFGICLYFWRKRKTNLVKPHEPQEAPADGQQN